MTLEYSIWSEIAGNETRWFWLVDKTIAGGIEDTKELALAEIKKYIHTL